MGLNPLGRKTVDGVLKNFRKAMDDLEAVAVESLMEAEEQDRRMNEALAKSRAAQAERDRAMRIRGNLEKLLGE